MSLLHAATHVYATVAGIDCLTWNAVLPERVNESKLQSLRRLKLSQLINSSPFRYTEAEQCISCTAHA